MAIKLTPELADLKRRFIVPAESIVDRVIPVRRRVTTHFYCPYAPCCSQCRGVFSFREVIDHLRRVHEHSVEAIKTLVRKGIPRVPERGISRSNHE